MKTTAEILFLVLLMLLANSVSTAVVGTSEVIYIKPDGSIDPANAPIQRTKDTYELTDDVNGSIFVQRSNASIDGQGYTLRGMTADADFGILLQVEHGELFSENVTIRNLNIVGFQMGVLLAPCYHCTIIGNNISYNQEGIRLSYGGFDPTFPVGSRFNVIDGNNIVNNDVGICIELSSYNFIRHNNIVNNTVQVLYPLTGTPTKPNTWDFGYPYGGNYWTDYAGIDQKSGPLQDELGSDGIGDTPYSMNESNADRYPLMGAWLTSSTPQPADVNHDEKVNIMDIALVAKAYNSSRGDLHYKLEYDLNNDGFVNIIDLALIANNFGKML